MNASKSAQFVYRVHFPDFSILRLDHSIALARSWAKKAFPHTNPYVSRHAERRFCGACNSSPCVCEVERKLEAQ